ncbi:MAG: YjjG family noncanonical pyrimidine nucleotidase [Clostridia bacterium]|nr:YjjG family noncanonical pyrimidine nucleotidase [Clostridia bacterium]MBO7319292.1 YjjG family noncanonical pyrimidine nucleotidase [Clostridia bacterium]
MKKYTTILFDADDTLLDFGKDETQALLKVLNRYSVPATEENIEIYKRINVGLWKALERGEIDKPRLKKIRFRLFFDEIGFETDKDPFTINEEYLSNLGDGGNLKEGAKQLIDELQEKGYDLYIVTNGIEKTQKRRLTNAGIIDCFTDIFVSEAIGFQKPRKEYFDYVLENIREKDIGRVLLVGDSLTSDIKGAENAGITNVWLRNSTDTDYSSYSPDFVIDDIGQLRDLL